MNSVECITRFTHNVRRLGLQLSGAQVLLALIKGLHRHRDIVADSGLHANTVTNILSVLVAQEVVYVSCAVRPRLYFLTERGVREARMLMDMKREEGSDG